MGKLTETFKDTGNNLTKFEDKILQTKIQGAFVPKVLAQYWQGYICDHFLPIFPIN